MTWSSEEILTATNGTILRQGKKRIFDEVVTDSGKVKRGSVFIAIKGERLDGHQFVSEAIQRGAGCVIVHRNLGRTERQDVTVVRVRNTLRALGDLAHYRREKIAPKVLAITGSNGKTTTKEMVAAILEEASMKGKPLRGRVLKTEGNFNNLVGLPLTLLRLRRTDKVAVVELGTNHPGEIRRLAEIADPDIGVVTSVAAAHLEGLDTVAGVAREKGALYRRVRSQGTIAVNLDDPWVRRLANNFKGRKITYGQGGQVRATSWRSLGAKGVEFTLRAGDQSCDVRLSFLGQHNILNALGAAAMAHGMGVSLPAIRRGLQRARPFPMRMQVQDWKGVAVINDAYNANPASMAAAIETLAAIDCAGHRIAVLGDMFELGSQSRNQHLRLGEHVARTGIDRLYLLGQRAGEVKKGALRAGMKERAIVIGHDHSDLAAQIGRRVQKGDWLLFKGSRGMKMENVFAQLKGRESGV
jgi:UDP-N-acetylmuramoyl-tripeptide--D-alanyl-D-alanine ligase